jgi:hypothetical protein
MRKFTFRKPRTVAGNALFEAEAKAEAKAKAMLELNACWAENNMLQAQVADLLRSCNKDRKEQCLEKTAMLETTAMSDSSIKTQAAEVSANEVQTLCKENVHLLLGARRDSETILRLANKIRALTHLAAEVVIAARSCYPSAKGLSRFVNQVRSVGLSAESLEGMAVELTVGTSRSIDKISMLALSVGTTEGGRTTSGKLVGLLVESSVRSSVGLSVRSSERSSVESSTGSSLRTPGTSIGSLAVSSMGSVGLQVRNACLHVEARSDFKMIKTLAEEAHIIRCGNGGPPSFQPSPICHVRVQNMQQGGGLVSSEGVK